MKRCIFLLSVFFIGLIFAVIHKPTVETDILKSVVTQENKLLFDVNRHINSDIIVMFKDESKEKFLNDLTQKHLGQVVSEDFSEYQNIIKTHPKSFLTDDTRNLLQNQNYSELQAKSMRLLYQPLNIPLVAIDKDPYLFVTDYFSNNFSIPDYQTLKIRTTNPKQVIKTAEKYDTYLAGAPVHSYKTAQKSAKQINIFCILATVFVIFMCKYIFGSYRVFAPVILSILFGFGCGYIAVVSVFTQIHILTFVFATTLIGIGVDYSFHYYAAQVKDKLFYKNLTSSMLTTITAFAFLMIPDIPLLRQISVYTIAGLIGVYLFVICISPLFKINPDVRNDIPYIKINKKWFVICITVILLLGAINLKTDDNIKNLYTPDRSLKMAESIYQQSANPKNREISFVITQNEDFVCNYLKQNHIDYVSETKFVPSTAVQKENITLVNNLYKNNDYPDFITKEQRMNLINNYNDIFEYSIPAFRLNNNQKIIMAYDLNLENIPQAEIINVQKDISDLLKNCRKQIEPLIPMLFAGMFLLLFVLYGKKAFNIILPPLIGVCTAISIGQLLGYGINIFSILTVFLIIGFTVDYSIFKASENRDITNVAIFAACISTMFSFILLSFASFKLISTFGVLLWVGILCSYISVCAIFGYKDSKQNWYDVKERSAGVKRLQLSYFIYGHFGRKPLEWIAWWVSLFTYFTSQNLRKSSNKYFEVLYNYTKNPLYKPSFKNCFKRVYSYAISLVDKMEIYANTAHFKFKINNPELEQDLNTGGLFFIFTHVGNIEAMRAFVQNKNHRKVSIFMQQSHCEIFNNFINSLNDNKDVTVFPIEDIGIETVMELKERLNNGEIVFMAGDRLAASGTNKTYGASFLGQKIELPLGTLKFALMLETPIYFISCLKSAEKFIVASEKYSCTDNKNANLLKLENEFVNFFERMTLLVPYQFYHFYDFFD